MKNTSEFTQVVLKGVANRRRVMPFVCVYVCVCMQTLFFHLICVFSCVSLLCGRDELLRSSLSSTVQRSVTVVLPPQVAEGHGVPLGPDALRAH